jgi:signal transduction histidine kinase
VNPLRNVGGRLALGLALVVAGALLLVDVIVVPSLERNLIDAKLGQLREVTPAVGTRLINSPDFTLHDNIVAAAESADARVVYYRVLEFNPPTLALYEDSRSVSLSDVEDDPLVLKAFKTSPHIVSRTVTIGGRRYAEVAQGLNGGPVVLLRANLHDSLQSVHLVRKRLVIAGLIALAASLLVGYLVAALHARRIRRLERAAHRIAGGDFGEPVVDGGKDEVGQLATAFDEMRRRLAQTEDARRAFIANASHELRTPLFSLGGFLELMSDEDLDPATQAEFMATMREQVARLTKLATDLLDLSRLDAGRLRVEEEQVDLSALAEILADEFRAVALSSGHELAVENGTETPALGDEERALQIGRILVENAIVHTPAGTAVRIRTARRNGSALLSVEDEGPGIPPEHAENVFERFYRLEGSVASGSGLGLAIARELASLMGGSVELQTDVGRTTFVLALPSQTDMAFSDENEQRPPQSQKLEDEHTRV